MTYEANAAGGINYSTVKYDGESVNVDATAPSMVASKNIILTSDQLAAHNLKVDMVQEVLNDYVKAASDAYKKGKEGTINSIELQIIMGALLSNQSSILALAA